MPHPFLARSFLKYAITFLALFQSHWTENRAVGLERSVVARASRPCVGCTIHTGGTPVPLPWKRHGRRNFVCSTCRVCEWLNTYGTSRPRRRPRPCSLAFLNTPSRRGQGVFENGSRRRKEADFGAKNISAFATRLRLAPKPEAKAEKRHSRRAVAPSQRVGGTAVRLVTF